MKCPVCFSDNTYVCSGVNVEKGYKRYRKCGDCGCNFVSMEVVKSTKIGRPRKMECEWCKRELHNWYLTYKGKNFCRYNNDACLKNYLFDEADGEIEENRADGIVDYDMKEVADSGR